MYFDKGLHLDDDDQCNSCEHFNKGVACPLLEALVTGFVTLTDNEVQVTNCGFYKPFKRHLNIVKSA
jgi:hypothetical protein